MNNLVKPSSVTELSFKEAKVLLENFGSGKGKISITYERKYGEIITRYYFWGSMGGSIEDFICRIDSGYFTNKLTPANDNGVIDVKKTFRNLRKFIAEEFDLPFYKEMDFQKGMREHLNDFQNNCESSNEFVDRFQREMIDMPFYLITNHFEERLLFEEFTSISETWHFLEFKPSEDYYFMFKIHEKIKKELRKSNNLK